MAEIGKDGVIRIPEPTPIFRFALTEKVIQACAALKTYERPELFSPEQFLPINIDGMASGWDVRAADDYNMGPGSYAKISLGFRVFAPDGWWLKLLPRSSTFTKKFAHALSVGVVDQTYEGECFFSIQYLPEMNPVYTEREEPEVIGYSYPSSYYSNPKLYISFGERIAQIIPVRRQEMICESVSNEEYDRLCAERGGKRVSGGYGSSGDK